VGLRPRLWPGVPLSRVAIVRLDLQSRTRAVKLAKGLPFPVRRIGSTREGP
jgi:hypothetical protein